MADNIQLSTNVGSGELLRTDDDGTAQWQYVKLAWGADNTQTIVTATAGIPVAPETSSVWTVDLGANNDVTMATLPDTAAGDLAAIVVVLGTIDTDTGVIAGDTTSIDAKIPALGTAAMAASSPVTIASDDTLTAAANTLLGTIDADTGAIKTAVEIIDNAVATEGSALGSGVLVQGDDGTDRTNVLVDTDGHLQVDVLTGGGSNASVFVDNAAFTLTTSSVTVCGAIRDDTLGALAAVEGDAVPLRVNSTGALHVTGAGGGTQYTLGTDTYTETTSVGTVAGAVRYDAGGTLADTDNEIAPLQVDANGALRVTGGGGGTEYTEDIATANPIVGTATVMERDDIIAELTPVAGDWAAMRCSAEGALWTQDFNSDAILALLGTIDADTSNITACNTGAVVLSSGTVTTVSTVTNLSQLGGAAIAMNAGVLGAGVQRVTIATDDECNNLLGTIDADTSALFGCVAGTEMQVDVVAALPAGTNAIGKLAANTGVDIGDVDVTSVVPGTAATNLGKARADALGATDTGVAPLAVRNDELADLAGADNDYTPLQVNEVGALFTSETTVATANASGVAATGTVAMVAALAGKKVRIHALFLKATSATVTNVYVATTTDLDVLGNVGNPIPLAVDADGDNDSGFVLPWNPGGWTTTSTANEALNLILSAAQDVIWAITYSYVS